MANNFIARGNLRDPLRNKKPADRSFILLGRVSQGKSSLANLIVNSRTGKFPVHMELSPNSKTTEVQQGQATVLVHRNEEMVIDILDQCGFNDGNISLNTHKNNLIRCILNANAKISVNYLILINLSWPHYEHEQFNMIAAITEWLTNESYTFSENAVIVFTHKDVLIDKFKILCDYCYSEELIARDLLCEHCSKEEPNLDRIRECRECRGNALTEGKIALRHKQAGQCQTTCWKCENGNDHPDNPCDKCIDNKLHSILTDKRNTDQWWYINATLQLIPKFIIINTLDMSERVTVLKELMDLTTPNLKILFHGNTDFSNKKIKSTVTNNGNRKPTVNPVKHKGFYLDLGYNPDYLAYKPPNKQSVVEKDVVDKFESDLDMVNALSVIMILINLTTPYGSALNEFILNIASNYQGFKSDADWWKYTVLVFYVGGNTIATSSDVNRIVRKNGELKSLVKKVNDRYIILQDITSGEEFLDSVMMESLKVKQLNRGKDFVNREVVKKLIAKVYDDLKKEKGKLTEEKFHEFIHEFIQGKKYQEQNLLLAEFMHVDAIEYHSKHEVH